MIATPQIMKTFAQPAAVIHLTIPREEMQAAFSPAVEEIRTMLAGQFVEPSGPVFTHHLSLSSTHFDFEVGVPINGAITNEGRVRLSELPAHEKVAHTVYVGPYEGLGPAWVEFTHWMKAQGATPAGEFWQIYAHGPESNSDSSNWRTELFRPLVD